LILKPQPTSKRFSKLHLNLYQVEANQKTEKRKKKKKKETPTSSIILVSFENHAVCFIIIIIIILEYNRLFLAMVLQ